MNLPDLLLLLMLCTSIQGSPPDRNPLKESSLSGASAQDSQSVSIFAKGLDGFDTFRIPSLVTTKEGTLLAFCEGRRLSSADAGNIDLVYKRSLDNGLTWSRLQTLWDDGDNTCGNPCPVYDATTGVIWILLSWNKGTDREPAIIARQSQDTRRVFVSRSSDQGLTWAKPQEITSAVKRANWTWYATGPGAGIQLTQPSHPGRLVIPCDHIEAITGAYDSHVIYSDDHGVNWKLGGSTPSHQVNECEVVELSDGRLMLNMRNYDRAQRTRQIAFSDDGGETWTDQQHAPELTDSICQASLRRYRWPKDGQPGIILFSNPNSMKRERMTIRASLDDGKSWHYHRLVESGPSAYSCLALLPDGFIGLLYERGLNSPYEQIVFARFSLNWLMQERSPTGATNN